MSAYTLSPHDTGATCLILQDSSLFGKKLYELMVSGEFHKLLCFLSLRDELWRREQTLGVLLPDYIHRTSAREPLRWDFFKYICEPLVFYFPDYQLCHIDWQPPIGTLGVHQYSPFVASYLQEQIHILNKAPIIKGNLYQRSMVLSKMIYRWDKHEVDGSMNNVLKQGNILIWSGKNENHDGYPRHLLHGGLWKPEQRWRILPYFHIWDISTPLRLHHYIKILFYLYGYQYVYNQKNQVCHTSQFQFAPNKNPSVLWSLETEIYQLAQAFHQKYASPINNMGWVLAIS